MEMIILNEVFFAWKNLKLRILEIFTYLKSKKVIFRKSMRLWVWLLWLNRKIDNYQISKLEVWQKISDNAD